MEELEDASSHEPPIWAIFGDLCLGWLGFLFLSSFGH